MKVWKMYTYAPFSLPRKEINLSLFSSCIPSQRSEAKCVINLIVFMLLLKHAFLFLILMSDQLNNNTQTHIPQLTNLLKTTTNIK